MGLLYAFPIGKDEESFVIQDQNKLVLKTYGLPYIFWVYALCSISVVIFMLIGIKDPILKLISLGDETDATLGYTLLTFIALLPMVILSFFFYEKRLIKTTDLLQIEHRLFGLKIFAENFPCPKNSLFVESFLSSPNLARMKGGSESLGFQNKGYFILCLKHKEQKIQIDKHSRKADLEKLKELIESQN